VLRDEAELIWARCTQTICILRGCLKAGVTGDLAVAGHWHDALNKATTREQGNSLSMATVANWGADIKVDSAKTKKTQLRQMVVYMSFVADHDILTEVWERLMTRSGATSSGSAKHTLAWTSARVCADL
jgi:hypothetical protein